MIWRSPHLDVSIPEIPLAPFVLKGARDLGDKPALIDRPTGRTLSFTHLADDVSKAAVGSRGEASARRRVRHLRPQCAGTGGGLPGRVLDRSVVTPISSLFTTDDVACQLKDSGARFLLSAPAFIRRAIDAADRTGIEEVSVIGEAEGATPFSALLAEKGDLPEVAIDPKKDLVVLRSSRRSPRNDAPRAMRA